MKHRHDCYVCFSAKEKDYVANFAVTAGYSPATREEPESGPELELCCVEADYPGATGHIEDADFASLGITDDLIEDLAGEAIGKLGDEDPPCRCGDYCRC